MRDERLKALIDLQSIVTRRYDLYRLHEEVPTRLEELHNLLATAQKKIQDYQTAIDENNHLLARSHEEIATADQRHADLQTRLNQVKNEREFEARQKEIKAHKVRQTELHTQIEAAQKKQGELQSQLERSIAEQEILTKRLQPEIKELESKKELFEQELQKVAVIEREQRSLVMPSVLERVDKLVLMRAGVAVVPIQADSCGGCGIQLSPQTIQVAKRGLDFLQCDRCSVYLYWEESD
jgi:predicted  nucleic acid-binding Zn-ribbon protein